MRKHYLKLLFPLMGLLMCAAPCVAKELPEGLTNRQYLFEVVRYLYRWHMSEEEILGVENSDKLDFIVSELNVELDEGDKSKYGMILIPQLGMSVKVKKSDYHIPEMDCTVKSKLYRVIRVSKSAFVAPSEGTQVISASYEEIRAYLFKTRKDTVFPEGELFDKMRSTARDQILENKLRTKADVPGTQIIHLAPLSSVANEVWLYWENGRMLIRYASDIDLENPIVWQNDDLAVRLFDLDTQVVVSLAEVSGSNAYLTREQVGRTLFNCMVLGKRLELVPSADTEE